MSDEKTGESSADLLDNYWKSLIENGAANTDDLKAAFQETSIDKSATELAALLDEIYDVRDELRTAFPPLPHWENGKVIGDYRILDVIGTGGMGIVYRAEQVSLDRVVALKTIRNPQASDETSLQRFREEAAAAARLQHPNIVPVHEIGEFEGIHFFSMDLIDGESLKQRLDGRPMQTRQAAELSINICEALECAHEQGILHRDLKPSNILIDQRERPFVSDFGLARHLDTAKNGESFSRLIYSEAIAGTPSYLSPEQVQAAGGQGVATDVYGVGATLYEMLTGRPPFVGNSVWETLRQVVEREPVSPRLVNPEVPIDLDTICLKCLAKDPHRRYSSATLLKEDLSCFVRGMPISARPTSRLQKALRWCRREPWLATAAGVATVLLLALLVSSTVYAMNLRTAIHETRSAETMSRAQRDQAINTLNEMVFALYAELERDPSSLNSRRDLLETVISQYEELTSSTNFDDAEQIGHGFVSAHIRLADVYWIIGREQEARQKYWQAIELGQQLYEIDQQPDFEIHVAEALVRMARLEFSVSHLEQADENLRLGLALFAKHQDRLVDNDRIQRKWMYASGLIGDIAYAQTRYDDAIDGFRNAKIRLQTNDHVVHDAFIQWLICSNQALVVACLTEQFRMDEATKEYELLELELAKLHQMPDFIDTPNRFDEAWLKRSLVVYWLRTGNPAKAIAEAEAAAQAGQDYLALRPNDIGARLSLANVYLYKAFAHRAQNELIETDQSFTDSICALVPDQDLTKVESARMLNALTLPIVFKMKLAQRNMDYRLAAKLAGDATFVLERLESMNELHNPIYISALRQTRRLVRAYDLVQKKPGDIEFAKQHDAPMAAVLLVFCCDYYEEKQETDNLIAASDALIALEPDDPQQFSIHMFSMAQAFSRCAKNLPEEREIDKQHLIASAMDALKRSMDLDVSSFSLIESEPDLDIVMESPGFETLVQLYRELINQAEK